MSTLDFVRVIRDRPIEPRRSPDSSLRRKGSLAQMDWGDYLVSRDPGPSLGFVAERPQFVDLPVVATSPETPMA
jgi:hypothetical protein